MVVEAEDVSGSMWKKPVESLLHTSAAFAPAAATFITCMQARILSNPVTPQRVCFGGVQIP